MLFLNARTPRFGFLTLAAIGACAVSGVSREAQAACSAQDQKDCRAYNRQMNQAYDSIYAAYGGRGDASGAQGQVMAGYGVLQSMKIPLFYATSQLAAANTYDSIREVVFQQWLRQQAGEGGMRWLPPGLVNAQGGGQTENEMPINARNMEAGLQVYLGKGKGGSNDDLLIAMQFASSVPHSDDQTNIYTFRETARTLGESVDYAGFYALRIEIHQSPSIQTLTRIREYIEKNRGNAQRIQLAQAILTGMEQMFAGTSLDSFIARFPDAPAELKAYLGVRKSLAGIKTASDFEKFLDSGKPQEVVQSLATAATRAVQKIRAAGNSCSFGAPLDCRYEWLDVLLQAEQASLAFSTQLFTLGTDLQANFSLRDILSLSVPLIEANSNLGLVSNQTADQARQWLKADQPLNLAQMKTLFDELKRDVDGSMKNLRGLFTSVSEKYRPFTPTVDRFVDDLVRTTPLLPLSNFVASVGLILQNMEGSVKFYVNEAPKGGLFQVINPGIAHGKLILAKDADMAKEGYVWQNDAIYFLPKTPAELHKVAGILTADSGSMISHVQLLAANHGLPNVYLSKRLVAELPQYEGKDVLLVSLPNGEAQIKLWSDATAAEKKAYNDYNQIHSQNRVTLKIPAGIAQYNYPMFLDQLRYTDRGVIAGGKACGQGELAHVFPNTVPRAIVLPFGVYFDHVKKAGIYEDVKTAFTDPAIRGDQEKLEKKLAEIRQKILDLKLSKEIVDFVKDVLARAPFTDSRGKQKGVFVRSDTNAEDLAVFVGAGLNDTKANRVGIDSVVEAIKQVWASPFTMKAFSWRADLINNPWDVFPSVIIQQGIPSEIAGVMVVGNVQSQEGIQDEVLVAANRGLGITVVNGEFVPEESVYSRVSKKITRIRRAHATTMKVLKPEGDVADVPIEDRDILLEDDMLLALAAKGEQMQTHMREKIGVNGKWDFEWGYVKGRFVLFQMRPFIGNKIVKDVGSLGALVKTVKPQGAAVKPYALGQRAFVLPIVADDK